MRRKPGNGIHAFFIFELFLLLFFNSASAVAEKNTDNERNGLFQVDGHWIGLNWPIAGKGIRSSVYGKRVDPFFGMERAHGGIDIAAPIGTSVLAALGGRVTKAGFGGELGKYVVIIHSGNRETIYGHLSEINVKAGQFTNPRHVIGKVGNSGRSTGPHLHFAVKKNGRFVDPEKWMVPVGKKL